jgi:hypothetical protein
MTYRLFQEQEQQEKKYDIKLSQYSMESIKELKRAEDCAICYEGTQLVDSVTLNCGHRFCASCIRSTLRVCERELPECALCRSDMIAFVVKSRDVYDSLTQFCEFL